MRLFSSLFQISSISLADGRQEKKLSFKIYSCLFNVSCSWVCGWVWLMVNGVWLVSHHLLVSPWDSKITYYFRLSREWGFLLFFWCIWHFQVTYTRSEQCLIIFILGACTCNGKGLESNGICLPVFPLALKRLSCAFYAVNTFTYYVDYSVMGTVIASSLIVVQLAVTILASTAVWLYHPRVAVCDTYSLVFLWLWALWTAVSAKCWIWHIFTDLVWEVARLNVRAVIPSCNIIMRLPCFMSSLWFFFYNIFSNQEVWHKFLTRFSWLAIMPGKPLEYAA